ncbi:TetR/AcrR family transcriptional regulator [Flexivirga meconopsidis]|uniref:TetR/AcrR family transcriptional regulator n=1 Tax=Flexivirga meconopsidis TaxID=2977121 RepID=UPI0022400960
MSQSSSGKPTDRRSRRQEQTRKRLVDAAHVLIAERGLGNVTIAEITEQADVGAGTFYNYFPNREAVVQAAVDDAIETIGVRFDALTREMTDPAEVVASSLRHLMGAALSDKVWGRFVVQLGLAHPALMASLGPRAARDIGFGIDEGRFDVPDLAMAADIVFGSLLSAIHSYYTAGADPDSAVHLAEYNLRMLGLTPADAAEVCRRPLPDLPSFDDARHLEPRPFGPAAQRIR